MSLECIYGWFSNSIARKSSNFREMEAGQHWDDFNQEMEGNVDVEIKLTPHVGIPLKELPI